MLNIYNDGYKHKDVDVRDRMMLTHSWLKLTVVLLPAMCVVTCEHTCLELFSLRRTQRDMTINVHTCMCSCKVPTILIRF